MKEQIFGPNGAEEFDPFTQIEKTIEFLQAIKDADEYAKKCSIFVKCLRHQTAENDEFCRNLVLLVENFPKFIKQNLQ